MWGWKDTTVLMSLCVIIWAGGSAGWKMTVSASHQRVDLQNSTAPETSKTPRDSEQLSGTRLRLHALKKQHLPIYSALQLRKVKYGSEQALLWASLGRRMACKCLLKGAVCFQSCDSLLIFLCAGETACQKAFVWTKLGILIAQLVFFPY